MSDVLVSLIRDALTGKAVTLSMGDMMGLPKVVKGLKDDPVGRIAVFEEAVRACAQADPTLRARLKIIVAELDQETARVQRQGRPA